MNGNEARFFSTLIIWAAITIIGVALMVTQTALDGLLLIILAFLMVGGAIAATMFIWQLPEIPGINAEKSKRKSRVERLMATLDEHELAELRAQLMADYDGEAVPLDELLAEYEQRARK